MTPRASHPSAPVSVSLSASPVRIRTASDADATRWNAFVNLCGTANFYQRFEWRDVNARSLGHRTEFLLAERGDAVVGVLPLVHVRSALFGHVISSMPFVNFGGPAALDEAAEAALLAAARAHAEASRCHYLELRATKPFDGMPTNTDKVSMTVPLVADPEALMKAFTQKHRHNLRRALKNALEVRAGGAELLDPFYGLMVKSWKDLGTPLYERAYFADILAAFGDGIRIFVAYHEGQPVATALNGHHRDTVEGMWAATDPAAHQLSPNYVLYWEMLRDACTRGFTSFHLGRSTKDSGAVTFKEKWLAQPKQLYWNYHLVRATGMPGLNPRNPKYQLAIRTWRRLPLPVLSVLGPRLARLIP